MGRPDGKALPGRLFPTVYAFRGVIRGAHSAAVWKLRLSRPRAAMVFAPTLPEDDFDKEKDVIRREIDMGLDDPDDVASRLLFSTAFGWALENSSAAGHDATDKDGVRYQIKSRRLTRHNGSRQLSFLRRLPEKKFDYLAAVLFDARYKVQRAIILPHEGLEARCRYSKHANGWLFRLEDSSWGMTGARDVTEEIRAAAEAI